MSAVSCNDLGICSHQYDAERAIEVSQNNLGFTAVCEDAFSHGYVGDYNINLFGENSGTKNALLNSA